jgi:hypothetical protein
MLSKNYEVALLELFRRFIRPLMSYADLASVDETLRPFADRLANVDLVREVEYLTAVGDPLGNVDLASVDLASVELPSVDEARLVYHVLKDDLGRLDRDPQLKARLDAAIGNPEELLIEKIATKMETSWGLIPSAAVLFMNAYKEYVLAQWLDDDHDLVSMIVEALCNKSAIEGDAEADGDLRLFARHFIAKGKPLPKPLKNYICKHLRGEGPKLKQGRPSLLDRDRVIVEEIQKLIEGGNSAEKACFIVSKALERLRRGMTKDAIQKIWTRRKNVLDRKECFLS